MQRFMMGGIFILAGVILVLAFGKISTFSCNRIQLTNCKLVKSGLLGSKSQEIPLNTLKGAQVERGRSIGTYRVVILTSSSEVPLTSYYSSDRLAYESIASQVNDFVKNPKIISLAEKHDDQFWGFLFGGIFIAAGVLILLGKSSES